MSHQGRDYYDHIGSIIGLGFDQLQLISPGFDPYFEAHDIKTGPYRVQGREEVFVEFSVGSASRLLKAPKDGRPQATYTLTVRKTSNESYTGVLNRTHGKNGDHGATTFHLALKPIPVDHFRQRARIAIKNSNKETAENVLGRSSLIEDSTKEED